MRVTTFPGRKRNESAQKTLLAVTVAVSVAAVVATLMITFGGDDYLWAQLPYVLIVILAIVFRKTVAGATISLISAVIIGGFGVYAWYTMPFADAVFAPLFLSVVGCGAVLLVQLVRWGWMRLTQQRS